jgi:hypothetical protein
MKKLILPLLLAGTLLLGGCFETTEEITLNEDGSGTFSNTNDMSALLGLAKEMNAKEGEKMGDEVMDTTMDLSSQADSITGLTPEEKEMMKKGSMQVHMNLKENKFITTMKFPFATPAEINAYSQLSAKVTAQALKDKVEESPMGGNFEGAPPVSSFDDYFNSSYSKGLLVKTLNKEKYAAADSDQYLKSMKESVSMGIPMNTTYLINLPRPATKVEGKNVQLSADKKKVTVKVNIDDFFDDPAKLEYRIEY